MLILSIFLDLLVCKDRLVYLSSFYVPRSFTKNQQAFAIENVFSDFLQVKKEKSSNDKTKAIQPKDYFAENMQAFAEDDPWEQY